MINRTQALVLGFFVLAVTGLVLILVAAPEVYDQALRLPTGSRAAEIAFLAALTGFIGLLGIGVLRRWRWCFWLILVAFLAGVLRVPVAILQLTRALAAPGPTWYVVFQGLLGVIQFAIGLPVGIAAAVVLFGLHLLDQQQRATSLVLRPPAQAAAA